MEEVESHSKAKGRVIIPRATSCYKGVRDDTKGHVMI
jgi:hypothetical protein